MSYALLLSHALMTTCRVSCLTEEQPNERRVKTEALLCQQLKTTGELPATRLQQGMPAPATMPALFKHSTADNTICAWPWRETRGQALLRRRATYHPSDTTRSQRPRPANTSLSLLASKTCSIMSNRDLIMDDSNSNIVTFT